MPRIAVTRVLPYQREKLFNLAADVERYPEFLPWWRDATIRHQEGDVYYTDQVVGFGPVTQNFATKTVLRRPDAIEVTSIDDSFETFALNWRFQSPEEGRCEVTLTGELTLRAPFLRSVFDGAVSRSADSILSAFEARARGLYGGD